MPDLKSILRQKAFDEGFIKFGVASAKPFDNDYKRFNEWLALGYNADMHWMERNGEKRRDVRDLLPGALSVIVLAYNYNSGHKHVNKPGKISRYAWNYDYHDILMPKLKRVSALIKESYQNSEFKCYIDTGPVLERQWAVRAGIGWQGKHSLVLSRDAGSFFFLSVIITTVKLEPDSPISDFCGNCTACIDACPTGAITQPYVVDSNKCISYWTIEAKADREIPEEIAANLNGFAFGCDICQDVCPWNSKSAFPSNDTNFHPRYDETFIPVEKLIEMEQGEFSARFKKSPVKRPKLAGIKRNAKALIKFNNNANNS